MAVGHFAADYLNGGAQGGGGIFSIEASGTLLYNDVQNTLNKSWSEVTDAYARGKLPVVEYSNNLDGTQVEINPVVGFGKNLLTGEYYISARNTQGSLVQFNAKNVDDPLVRPEEQGD